MKCLYVVFIITIVTVNEARCGVIGSVYEGISNRTQVIKDDVYSWWSYGVDTIMGSDDNPLRSINENAADVINRTKTEVAEDSGIIAGIYNKVKGGVTYGYMKVHDAVLGADSDPNKGIIRTFYERAMNRLRQIRAYIFDDNIGISQAEAKQKEDEREKVLKVLFGNNTNLFSKENEKQALDSLRNKLKEAGGNTLHLLDNERDVIKKAYEYVHNKPDELKTEADKLSVNIKEKAQESMDWTKEFIKDIGVYQIQAQKREDEREKVLRVLFGNNNNLFTNENEKQALNSLRNKLTEAGDKTLHLLDGERDVIKKAYEYVQNKENESKVNQLSVNIKDKGQESIDSTKDFIKDASNKVSDGAQNFGENVKKSVNDIEHKLQSQ